MREIGLMRSMMAMASRRGPGEADIAGSIGGDCGTELGFIGFILVMFMLGSGLMGSAMAVELTPVRMGVGMLGSSSGVGSMGLDITISGEVLMWDVMDFFIYDMLGWCNLLDV